MISILVGCHSNDSTLPEYISIGETPTVTSIEQVIIDYTTDQQAADAKYKGKKLVFYNIVVETVQSWFPHGQYHEDPMPNYIKGPDDYWFITNSVIFRPRDPIYLYGIITGSVVDVVGICDGLSDNKVVITDAWIKRIGGETGVVDY